MTLNCSAYNCIYNNSGACYAGRITISGLSASKSSNTYCSTFSEGKGNLTNISSNYFTTSNDITCKAVHCYHNYEGTCIADSVHINDNHIQCDTFISDEL